MELKGIKQIIKAGITQKEICERARISPEQLSRYLNNKSTPTYITLEKLSKALKITVDEITNGLK